MGVHGLWRLIEPSGKPVPLETLENKVLAVDVSIWLHQAIRGFQDSAGAPLPNAHLLGIYHRVCKLLYFRVKPVFVFDGGVPLLKKQTIAKRNQIKSRSLSEAEQIQKRLLNTILKHSAINKVLSEKTKAIIASTSKIDDNDDEKNLFFLPPTQIDSTLSSLDSESESDENPNYSPTKWDLHTIDMESSKFKNLPADVRHEILTDLKETRKQNSWGRLHELPTQSNDFSSFQMRRLLKRQAVQNALEEAEKEMGGHSLSLGELESLLKDHGVLTKNENLGSRIASDENKRFLLIKSVKEAMEVAKLINIETKNQNLDSISTPNNKATIEFENDLKRAIALSLESEPSTSTTINQPPTSRETTKIINPNSYSHIENFLDADFESDSSEASLQNSHIKLTSAQNYMTEYSGLTPSEITKILNANKDKPKKRTKMKGNLKKVSRDQVEIISNSDLSSDEFVEVDLKEPKPFEIVINKNDDLEDDLFNDIFANDSTNQLIDKIDLTITNQIENRSPNDYIENTTKEIDKLDKLPRELEGLENSKSNSIVETILKIDQLQSIKHQTSLTTDITSIENKIIDELDKLPRPRIRDSERPETKSDSIVDLTVKTVQLQPNESLFNLATDIKAKDNEIIGEIDKLPKTPKMNDTKNLNTIKSNDQIASLIEISTKTDHITDIHMDGVEGSLETISEIISEVPKDTNVVQSLIQEYSKTNTETLNSPLSIDQLNEIKTNLMKEQNELISERNVKERNAGNITDQMHQEAQELLELFGVPYVVAPMEAEAQCAFLDEISLTDGTITDDSDIWLFGGKTVYKNFFSHNKQVMEFKAENILHQFKLTREQMVLLALLVGSDYTVGLQGIGPVTALEILAAFPPKSSSEVTLSQIISGLAEFKSWMKGGRKPAPGRTSLKSKVKNVVLNNNFPSAKVVNAYLNPEIDSNRDKFSWAKPDIAGLVDFAKRKFGWSKKKSEDILGPVIKRMGDNHIQTTIKQYFKTLPKFESKDLGIKMSKRVRSAVNKIGKGPMDDANEPKPQQKRVQKNKKKKHTDLDCDDDDEDVQILKQTEIKSRKRVEEIVKEAESKITEISAEGIQKIIEKPNLRKKEAIPQKLKEKNDMLKSKLRAIEVFRKSKQGPGFVQRKKRLAKLPKEDAGLSESSSDD